MGKNMKGMGQRAKGHGRGLAQSFPLAELSPEGLGKDGFLQKFDLRKDCFGCVLDLLFLDEKVVEDADDLLLFGFWWQRNADLEQILSRNISHTILISGCS